MSDIAMFSVRQLGEFPATRGLGQDGRARLDDLLGERTDVDLTIDFAGVRVMNISFADEFLGKFLASHDFSHTGTTVAVCGLNADNLYSVVVCVERRSVLVTVLGEDDSLILLGDKILAETFEHAVRLAPFKASDLANAMGLTAQNANNRLKRLANAGAVRKAQITGSTRGGKEYVYQVAARQVANSETFASA